jgi:hypothetical protein
MRGFKALSLFAVLLAALCLPGCGGCCKPDPVPPVVVPTPPVVVDGPRQVLIVHESGDSTPEFGRLVTLLRSGPAADYLASENHSLLILDVDSVGPDGQPAAVLAQFSPQYADLPLPVVLIIEPTSRKVLHAQSLPAGFTADNLTELVRQHGG